MKKSSRDEIWGIAKFIAITITALAAIIVLVTLFDALRIWLTLFWLR